MSLPMSMSNRSLNAGSISATNGILGYKSFSKAQIITAVVVFIAVIGLGVYFYYSTKSVTTFHANRENVPKDDTVKSANVMLFYVDWCPHCKTAKPVWNEMKTEYEGTIINGYKVSFIEYNCTKETPETQTLMDKYKIEGFPSIILIKDNQVIDYDAKPSKATMVQFLNTVL